MPRSVKDLRQFTAAIHVFFSIILASALDQLSIASTNLADAHNAQHFWDFYSSQKKRITITLSVARAPVQNGRIKNVLFVTKSIYYKCCFWGVFRVIACDFQYKTAPFFCSPSLDQFSAVSPYKKSPPSAAYDNSHPSEHFQAYKCYH